MRIMWALCVSLGLLALGLSTAEAHGPGHVCHAPALKPEELRFTRANVIDRTKLRPRAKADADHPNLRIHVNIDQSILDLPNVDEVTTFTNTAIEFWKRSLLNKYPSNGPMIFERGCSVSTQQVMANVSGVLRSCCVKAGAATCARKVTCAGADVPEDYLTGCCVCESRTNLSTCRMESEDGPGINGTDFLMLAIAKQVSSCLVPNVLAYATACFLDDYSWRPVVGVVNLCAGVVNHTTGLDRYSEVQVLKHEISHALGFNSGLYAFFRNESGEPMSPVDPETGFPQLQIIDNRTIGYVVSEDVVRRVKRDWDAVGGKFEREFIYIVTKTVTNELRNYFNCSILEGAELENHGSSGTAGSHFEKRIFPSEAMNGVLSEWMNMSSISLAFMQDTGWYVANFSNAEPYTYGKGLGCGFARDSCMNWIRDKRAKGENPAPYCDILSSPSASRSERRGTCTSNHDQVALCSLTTQTAAILPMYQYWNATVPNGLSTDNPARYGGFEYADYCPYLQLQNMVPLDPAGNANRYRMCKNSAAQAQLQYDSIFETYGPSSICMRQASPARVYSCVNNSMTVSDANFWGAGCYEVVCSATEVRIRAQDRTLHTCTKEYEEFTFEARTSGVAHQGTLVCPSCADACGSSTCPMAKTNASTVNPERLLEVATSRSFVALGAPSPGVCYTPIGAPQQLATVTVRVDASTPANSLVYDLPYVLYDKCGTSPSTCSLGTKTQKAKANNERASANSYKVNVMQQVSNAANLLTITFYATFSADSGATEEVPQSVAEQASTELHYVTSVGLPPTSTSTSTSTSISTSSARPIATTKVIVPEPQPSESTDDNLYEILLWVSVGVIAVALVVIITVFVLMRKAKSQADNVVAAAVVGDVPMKVRGL